MRWISLIIAACGAVACASPDGEPVPGVNADAGVDASTLDIADPVDTKPFGCASCTVFVGTFFDGESFQTGGVSVRDGIIDAVVTELPVDVVGERIDLDGDTLLPGMFDLHVHSSASGAPYGYFPPRPFIEEQFKANLRNGVTSVLDLGTQDELIFEMRERIRTGDLLGPRLFAAGPMFTAPGGHPCTEGPPTACRLVDDEADVVPQVSALLSEHSPDVIKVIVEGGSEEGPLHRLEPEHVAAIAAAAGDVPVIAHVGSAADVRDSLAAGITKFAHIPYSDELSPEDLDALRDADAAFVSTIAVADGLARLSKDDLDDPGVLRHDVPGPVLDAFQTPAYVRPHQSPGSREFAEEVLTHTLRNFAALRDAGVRVVVGTDAGNPNTFHGRAVTRELELYLENGASIEAALTAVTADAAAFLDAPGGSVRAGAPADLVVIDGDPREDVSSLRSVQAVWLGGQHLDPDALSVTGDFALATSPPTDLAEGERCLAPSECGEGLTCQDWAFLCRPSCEGGYFNDCETGVCFESTWEQGGYCFYGDGCDLFAQDCVNDSACLWLGNGETTCWYAAEGRQGEACSASNACAAGFQCSFSTGRCAALCDPDAPTCPDGTTCFDLSRSAGLDVGECR